MATERIEALEALMRTAGHCARLSCEFVDSFRRRYLCLFDRRILDHQWKNLGEEIDHRIPSLEAKARALSLPRIDYSLYFVIEESNLDFLRPVRFREFDFLTATEAASQIAGQLIEDCNAITDWPNWPNMTEEDHLEDCKCLLATWEPLTDDLLRDWALQVEIECRRAIRDEYVWLERQQTGEIEEGQLRFREKVAERRKRVNELRIKHNLASNWARLAQLAQDDEQIKSLGLPAITRDTVRNDCIRPKRRRGKR